MKVVHRSSRRRRQGKKTQETSFVIESVFTRILRDAAIELHYKRLNARFLASHKTPVDIRTLNPDKLIPLKERQHIPL